MRRLFQLLFVVGLSCGQIVAAPSSKPNIIFILADDLGIGNVSCYGADNYKTPNIDRLAAEGTRFTHAYTAPLCGPSRALIMTGRYAFRTGATNQDATGRMKPGVETMMPAYLKPAGYVTSCIGKWGQLPLGPAEFGFDDHFKFRGSGVYWNATKKPEKYWVNGEEKNLGDKEYMPELMHAHLVDFITKHREDPFYIYYSMSHVHGELQRTPDSEPNPADLMADNCLYMDKLVGKLVAELERLKLREKTLLIFMGDNGTGKAWADKSTVGGRHLSGQKGSMLECGSLVPMIVNWPGITPSGRVCEDFVVSTDFVSTFADLAGAKLPADKILDSQSILPQLRGEKGTPRDHIFMELAREWYVRGPGWKLNQKGELFDMSDAPFEEKLVAATADTDSSKAAREHLGAILAKLNPAGGALDDGDGSGRHSDKSKKAGKKLDKKDAVKNAGVPESAPATKPETTTTAKPQAASDDTLAERSAKFDRLDTERHGRLTLEEYKSRQSDPEAAEKRFKKFDADRDGFVTRDEYLNNGAKKLKSPK